MHQHLDNGYYWIKGTRQHDVIFTKVLNDNMTFFVWDHNSQSSKEYNISVKDLPEKASIIRAFTS